MKERNMKARFRKSPLSWMTLLACCIVGTALADDARSPFGVSVALEPAAEGSLVRVSFELPQDCVLYADRLHFFTTGGAELVPASIPEPLLEPDRATGKQKKVYAHSFWADLKRGDLAEQRVTIKFQGCTNGACFFPEKRSFVLRDRGSFSEETDGLAAAPSAGLLAADWANAVRGFTVTGRQTGYLNPADFTAFLDQSVSGRGPTDDPLVRFRNLGVAATLLVIVLGGFLLNFTPCVLPMIPINLAIIGAGSKARTRTEGFRNGTLYGLGIALAYGALGLMVVLTGSKFGTLNSTVWFNLLVAGVFLVMALGMFDIVNIDLARFGGGFGSRNQSAGTGVLVRSLTVFAMGGLAALLAGACVAPVVISVMLLSASLYAKGMLAGLSLPFLLGTGMALPWPLAGAGIAFLPKPGKWMKWIKCGFGSLILCFGLYYSHLAYHAFALNHSARSSISLAQAPSTAPPQALANQANQALLNALQQARVSHRDVFVDFRAGWCKNCLAMDATVFNQPEVQAKLKHFIVVQYDAEQPGTSPTRELLDQFGVLGLPTYLVMKVNDSTGKLSANN
jgi:thiol:disulfide interchange protein